MNSRRVLSSPALWLVAAVFAVPLRAEPGPTSPDSAQQISALHDEWVNDWKSKNLEDLRTLYDQDAVLLRPEGD